MELGPIRTINGMKFAEWEAPPSHLYEAGTEDTAESRVCAMPPSTTLEHARQLVSFPITLPQWMPDGFTRQQRVVAWNGAGDGTGLTESELPHRVRALVQLFWRNEAGGSLALTLSPVPPPHRQEVRLLDPQIDTLAEVLVADTPAALIQRAAGPTPKLRAVFPTTSTELHWRVASVQYELSIRADYLRLYELIRIAESVRPAS